MSDGSNEQEGPSEPVVGSIPVTITNPSSGRTVAGKRALVVAPNAGEVGAYSNARAQTCGTCRKFRLHDGQAAMAKQRFLERIVIEEGWKTKYLGASPKTYGLCAETNETITSYLTTACEHWRDRNGAMIRGE
jgi:hypothetical protein